MEKLEVYSFGFTKKQIEKLSIILNNNDPHQIGQYLKSILTNHIENEQIQRKVQS